jgi:TonB family protein
MEPPLGMPPRGRRATRRTCWGRKGIVQVMRLPSSCALAALLCATAWSGCAATPPPVKAPVASKAPTPPPPMSRDEVELRERAVRLCQHHQFDAPAPSRLPEGTRTDELMREVDLDFVRAWPDVARRTPVDAPAAFAEVARHLRCEVQSVHLRQCSAAVTVRQRRPRWEDPSFPAEALLTAETPEQRQAVLASWMKTQRAWVTETQRLTFSRSPSGWRADYELPERTRGLTDPFFAPVGRGPVLPDALMPPPLPKEAEAQLTAPQVLCQSQPHYTEEAVAARVQGQAIIKCILTPEGSTKKCRVLKTLPLLEEALLNHLYDTRFKPATFQGEPVQIDYTFTLNFQLPR